MSERFRQFEQVFHADSPHESSQFAESTMRGEFMGLSSASSEPRLAPNPVRRPRSWGSSSISLSAGLSSIVGAMPTVDGVDANTAVSGGSNAGPNSFVTRFLSSVPLAHRSASSHRAQLTTLDALPRPSVAAPPLSSSPPLRSMPVGLEQVGLAPASIALGAARGPSPELRPPKSAITRFRGGRSSSAPSRTCRGIRS
jgi:hypothetical protein